MEFKRFLSNCAKTFLVAGVLSISAYAGADHYNAPSFNHDSSHDLALINNDHYDSHSFEKGCAPVDCCHENVSCAYCPPPCAAPDCCGSPCLEAPACSWGYNPPAYPRCGCDTARCDGGGFLDSFSFRADFLWWRACEEGLELGTYETVDSFAGTTLPVRTNVINSSRVKQPNFKYDPGFRIGIANYCSCDCWDFAVNWTHFHTKAKSRAKIDIDADTLFFSDWERVVGANASDVYGRYSLNLDLVDIEFGRKFYVSNCFVLRPEFGLRFARIHQTYRIESSFDNDDNGVLDIFESNAKSRSNFLAVGPRVGLDVELQLCGGLSFFGCAAGSIVFGKFDNHSREKLFDFTTEQADSIQTYNYEEKSSGHRCSRTITDLAFGIKWVRCFEWCNRSHPVGLAFAWEHHAFYDMNNFNFASRGFDFTGGTTGTANGTSARKHGDLTTHGLTVSLCFGF